MVFTDMKKKEMGEKNLAETPEQGKKYFGISHIFSLFFFLSSSLQVAIHFKRYVHNVTKRRLPACVINTKNTHLLYFLSDTEMSEKQLQPLSCWFDQSNNKCSKAGNTRSVFLMGFILQWHQKTH